MKEEVYEIIDGNPGIEALIIAHEFGLDLVNTYEALHNLELEGRIIRKNEGIKYMYYAI